MTDEETMVQLESLKSYLVQAAGDADLADFSGQIAEKFVVMIPDEKTPGLVVLGRGSASFKFGNICFDLKKAAITTAEWAATSARPDSLANAFRLIITTAIWIARVTKVDITDIEASLVAWMHQNNMYEHLEEEEELIVRFLEYYCGNNPRTVEKWEVEDAIKRLYEIRCIDIVNGKICLCEKVWGSR